MDTQYKEALTLYNQCEYEKAYDILSCSQCLDDKSHRLLLEECKKQILQQYIYKINEAKFNKDIAKANQIKVMYTEKYGKNELISKPEDDKYFFLISVVGIPLFIILCLIIMIINSLY